MPLSPALHLLPPPASHKNGARGSEREEPAPLLLSADKKDGARGTQQAAQAESPLLSVPILASPRPWDPPMPDQADIRLDVVWATDVHAASGKPAAGPSHGQTLGPSNGPSHAYSAQMDAGSEYCAVEDAKKLTMENLRALPIQPRTPPELVPDGSNGFFDGDPVNASASKPLAAWSPLMTAQRNSLASRRRGGMGTRIPSLVGLGGNGGGSSASSDGGGAGQGGERAGLVYAPGSESDTESPPNRMAVGGECREPFERARSDPSRKGGEGSARLSAAGKKKSARAGSIALGEIALLSRHRRRHTPCPVLTRSNSLALARSDQADSDRQVSDAHRSFNKVMSWLSGFYLHAAEEASSPSGPGPGTRLVLPRTRSDGAEFAYNAPSPLRRAGGKGSWSMRRASWSMWVPSEGHLRHSPSSPSLDARFMRSSVAGFFGRVSSNPLSVQQVVSLDQLYAQAAVLYPLLKSKVQQWALHTNGMFPTADPASGASIVHPLASASGRSVHLGTGFGDDTNTLLKRAQSGLSGSAPAGPAHAFHLKLVKWADVVQDKEQRERVQWPLLKGPQRAVEKLSRSYQGKVSRLLDICRQSIIFEKPSELAACLRVIANDPDVSIARITNRFDREYNARKSLGYRDLNLNLRIDTPETRALGAELHLCEVQMLPRKFSDLKSSRGHKRYVAFRNARGQ